MQITNKIVYIKNRETFEQLKDSIPEYLKPVVFIEDTRELWTCGTYFSIGYPGIYVSEKSGQIIVSIGDSSFTMETIGDTLSIRKGEGNSILLSSNALSSIDAEAPLYWDNVDKKLIHNESGVIQGNYGQSNTTSNASVFNIPNITVNKTGHITSIQNTNVEIRDYVDQLNPITTNNYYNILLAYSQDSSAETNAVRKANGLSFDNATQKLLTEGGIISNGGVDIFGDLNVTDGYIIGKLKGDVEGSATPKIHLSENPDYGGASLNLYGHVLLKDELPVEEPSDSSSNTNVSDATVVAIAASPKMVWNSITSLKDYFNTNKIVVKALNAISEQINISTYFNFGKDFVVEEDNTINLNWEEINE